jgi:hypothetical protein
MVFLENDENVPSKRNKQKNFFLNLFFVGILKVPDEKSRILIWIRKSVVRIPGSGSLPKCHGMTSKLLV